MASGTTDSCTICLISYNEVDRKAVTLPCEHRFCLTCLVRLQNTKDNNCHVCRQDWSHFFVVPLPGMILSPIQVPDGLDEVIKQKIKANQEPICPKHNRPYLFWCDKKKELCCRKCVVENQKFGEFIDLEDSIPLIKSDISNRTKRAAEDIQKRIDKVNNIYASAAKKLAAVKLFRTNVQVLEKNLSEFANNVKSLKTDLLKTLDTPKKIQNKLNDIRSEHDVKVMQECIDETKKLKTDPSNIAQDCPDGLLCHIACTYSREMVPQIQDKQVSSLSFATALLTSVGCSQTILNPLSEAGKSWQDEKEWLIRNSGLAAAPYALALGHKQPSSLRLAIEPSEDSSPPDSRAAVAAVARSKCEVKALFLDSLFCPDEHSQQRDAGRLEQFLTNSSRLVQFYGHLDGCNMAKLPPSVMDLGLCIDSPATAAAVSSLKVWPGLVYLIVAVASSVAVQDLLPLPPVQYHSVLLYGLTDGRLQWIRPALDALQPNATLEDLWFAKCELTEAGALRLARELKGMKIENIYFDAGVRCLSDLSKRKNFETVVKNGVPGVTVEWDCDFAIW